MKESDRASPLMDLAEENVRLKARVALLEKQIDAILSTMSREEFGEAIERKNTVRA
jgi:hypothetical protein